MNMRVLKDFSATCAVPALALLIGWIGAPSRADETKDSQAPPKGATILFNAKDKDLSGWTTMDGKPAEWKVEDDYMEVVPRKGNIRTKETFGPDFQLHVEFWIPLMADKKDQARGNSGVYLQGRYEIQVLDSYMNETYKGGECGALYGLIPTTKNPSKPPELWQTSAPPLRSP